MKMKRRPGFTLVELLVAISILALVAVLGWRGLDGIVRARVALEREMLQTRGMQLAFAQMQSDCEHLGDAMLLKNRQNVLAENDRLTLIRIVYADSQAAQLQVVSYRIKDGVLARRESNGTRDLGQLDVLWQAALSDLDPSPGVALQAGVAGMAMRLWDGSAWQVATAATAAAAVQAQQTPAALLTVPLQKGLEVALHLQGQTATALIKVFLLGPV